MAGPNDRLDQVSRESFINQTAKDRVDQVNRESFIKQTPDARVDEVSREAFINQTAKDRISQVVRECWVPIFFSTTFRVMPIVVPSARKHLRHARHVSKQSRAPVGTTFYQPWCFVST